MRQGRLNSTIYRDIDALSAAGIPVYSERGPEGGYKLLEGYRVRLNGMSSRKAEALVFSGMSGPAAILGLGSLLASAQNKLMVTLQIRLFTSSCTLVMKSRYWSPPDCRKRWRISHKSWRHFMKSDDRALS
ncbi:HTH domain-containing protein [Cohaesibacter marisflavi]|uniref:HTH domain-containing protein n=1 Tax=Cohaesibacter marisflavi TaxID=655353 RepID=A0A1I5HS96_9HYPH|nr:HTH domain-containing protein [Cohaesibacter marisflavi]